MDMDLGTLCLLGIFLIVGFMLLSRMMGGRAGGSGYGGTDFSQRGSEQSQFDSPEVKSRGAFGRPAGFGSMFRRRSGGSGSTSGGSSGGFFGGGRSQSSGSRANSPEVKSRGSFGRPKR